MEAGDLKNLEEKVRAVAQGPQADLLRKFVDLLYQQPMGERQEQGQTVPMGQHHRRRVYGRSN